MAGESIRKSSKIYAETTAEIRRLSSVLIHDSITPDDYVVLLEEQFKRIRDLAVSSRNAFLGDILPILESDHVLSEEEREVLKELYADLLNGYSLENLDIMIAVKVADRLLLDAKRGNDVDYIIEQLDNVLTANYTMMNVVKRIKSDESITGKYRDAALTAAKEVASYLEPEKWNSITKEETLHLILIDIRYMAVLFEGVTDPEQKKYNLEILRRAIEVSKDPLYVDRVPGYDWDYHLFRTHEYYGLTTEDNNARDFEMEQLREIYEKSERLMVLWQKGFRNGELPSEKIEVDISRLRNMYLVYEIDDEHYRQKLLSYYDHRNTRKYDLGDIFANLLIPTEYLLTLKETEVGEEEISIIRNFYENALAYAFRMQNTGALNYMLEYYSALLWNFYELPGGMKFGEMVLKSLAALHPPTYVHSVMVGRLTRAICGVLIMEKPELFVGVLDTKNLQEVKQRYLEIVDFAYHAALLHDAGKIAIIDTIFIYGRNIIDEEYALIRQHPDMGYQMLSRYRSTRKYANIARCHHKYYDNLRGYPFDVNTEELSDKIITDIVAIADCLDAATDGVGRSYNNVKTLEEMLEEFRADPGQRYNPEVVAVMTRGELLADLVYLLDKGRKASYMNAYALVHEMSESVD